MSGQKQLPGAPFLLLGAGPRRKFVFRGHQLKYARSGEILRAWPDATSKIVASEHRVDIEYSNGKATLLEDEQGIWLEENGARECLSDEPVNLPRFEKHRHAELLRALHHEIVVNVVGGEPLPCLLVYDKAWFRDAAMMCLCLQKTGHLDLVKDWILGLREPFDRNNGGHSEPDNLGQLLYMISLVSDASHPLAATILREVEPFKRGDYIVGLSDFAEHPVYQTKWLKFGLRALGLPDEYSIPAVYDSYSSLFWMDFRDSHVDGARFDEKLNALYPYLRWAEAHFYNEPFPMELSGDVSPLTWEIEASQAHYEGIQVVGDDYATQKIGAPHTWHAAEMFLYLLEDA